MSADPEKGRKKETGGFAHMYDLVERQEIPRRRNPVAEALEREDEQLVHEAERLRLEAVVEESRGKVQALKNKNTDVNASCGGGQSMANPMSSLMMMLVSQGLDPIKANEYIKALDNESMMKLSVLGGQNSNSLLPLIMLGSKQGTSIDDIVKVVGAIISMSKTGQNNGGDNAMLMKLMTEVIPNMQSQVMAANTASYQAQILQLRQEMIEMKPKNPVDYVKDVADAAAALGMRQGGAIDIETQKLMLEDKRAERELTSKREGDRENLETLKSMIDGRAGDLIAMAGGAIKEKFMGGGEKANNPGAAPPRAEQPHVLTVRCGNCGEVFRASANAKAAMCPKCRTNLTITTEPPAQEEAEGPQQVGQDPSRVASFAGEGDLKPVWSGPPPKD